jgi:ubiquinone/menaquinone biosynthesis C-methylase UbiE
MAYILENKKEFERLESQSKNELYDFKKELSDFELRNPASILDAGCGSGIVSRYLSQAYPKAQVVGCDSSDLRVEMAKQASAEFGNLNFTKENLTDLSFKSGAFDGAVCRFVLEHLSKRQQKKAVAELFRCLRPAGKIRLIDIDGYFYNLFPQTPLIQKFLSILDRKKPIDMMIGRTLPSLLVESGFENVSWRIETMEITGRHFETEIKLIEERFNHGMEMYKKLLGSEAKAKRFQSEFVATLRKPGATLFYNKFVVTAEKPHLKLIEE